MLVAAACSIERSGSGEEPERARGLNIDTLWADELACWQRAESTWNLIMLALRAGSNPQAMITTTPRRRRSAETHPRIESSPPGFDRFCPLSLTVEVWALAESSSTSRGMQSPT